MQTIRFYFEHGTKAAGLSRWQRIWNNRLASRLIREAKHAGIKHVISFNVSVGYLHGQVINWGAGETISMKYPQCVEMTDTAEKLSKFLLKQKDSLSEAKTVIVEKQEIIIFKNE